MALRPPGLHGALSLTVITGFMSDSKGDRHESLVISAPTRAHFPVSEKDVGCVCSRLCAAFQAKLWSGRPDGPGIVDRLDAWTRRARSLDTAIAVDFPGEPFEPSPYSPISRLFWNEFYIDPAKAPEFSASKESQRLMQSATPIRSTLVDYRETMREKRRVLEALAALFFDQASNERRKDFDRFLADNPEAREYARFRARTDLLRMGWRSWPQTVSGDDRNAEQYYLYAHRFPRRGGSLSNFDGYRWVHLVPFQFSEAVRRGNASNHLELTCVGSAIIARINGTEVASARTAHTTAAMWPSWSEPDGGSPLRRSRSIT